MPNRIMEINSTFLTVLSILIAIVTFFIGVLVSNYFQKRANKREKVIDIDRKIFTELRSWVDLSVRCLKDHDIFDWTYSDIRMKDAIRSDNIERIVLKSDIYEKKSGSFVLSYKKDGTLKKYSARIIMYSEAYRDNFKELEKIVESIDYEKYYVNLERGIEPLLININRNIADLKNGNHSLKKDLQMIILSILFDNPRLYPNGHTARINLLNERYKETQKIVFYNQDLEVIGEKITRILDSLIINLEGMQKELINLHNEWRDQYHI
jgi:hypothetical protein